MLPSRLTLRRSDDTDAPAAVYVRPDRLLRNAYVEGTLPLRSRESRFFLHFTRRLSWSDSAHDAFRFAGIMTPFKKNRIKTFMVSPSCCDLGSWQQAALRISRMLRAAKRSGTMIFSIRLAQSVSAFRVAVSGAIMASICCLPVPHFSQGLPSVSLERLSLYLEKLPCPFFAFSFATSFVCPRRPRRFSRRATGPA